MTIPPVLDYKDRRTGLVLFGIFEILIGCLCALSIPLLFVARAMANRHGGPAPQQQTLYPMLGLYAFAAVAFIWLGIGSILARRWARTILLCLSAVALCVGVIAIVFTALLAPHLEEAVRSNRPGLPPGAFAMVRVIMIATQVVMYIIIPGALFLFYRSPHVKRTCEARDPLERWTDRCPAPVLAMCLVIAPSGIAGLALMASLQILPVFGYNVTGIAAVALSAVLVFVALYIAWGLYHLKIQAWWIALGFQLLYAFSGAVTFWRPDSAQLFSKFAGDERTAATLQNLLHLPLYRWLLPIGMLPWLIWLLWIRKYFLAPPSAPEPILPTGPVVENEG